MTQDQDRIDAMERLCAGMTTAELRDAPFTYQSLLQIVRRRDDRVPLSALVLPEKESSEGVDKFDNYNYGQVDGWNDAIDIVQDKINQLMEKAK